MAFSEYLKLIQQLDEQVRGHNLDQAHKLINELNFKEIPSQHRGSLAALARRANIPLEALKILWPNIHESSRPLPEDVIEYAGILRKLGLVHQALNLLSRLPESPEQQLSMAFCYIHHWDYKSAEAILETCLKTPAQDTRFYHLAQVNLASCKVFLGEFELALHILSTNENEIKKHNQHLYLNALELKGHSYTGLKNFKAAEKVFHEAKQLAGEQNSITGLFIEKGLLYNQLSLDASNVPSEEIQKFKTRIRKLQHWESLRDFDAKIGAYFGDQGLLLKAFFGTPFESFRKNIPLVVAPDQTFQWQDGRMKEPTDPVDFYKLQNYEIPFGMNLHRLWMLLASDFYRPFSVARIFDYLFQDEIFDPFTSKSRIHQLIFNLNHALKKTGFPELIETTEQGYRTRPLNEFSFVVRQKMIFEDAEDLVLEVLKTQNIDFNFKREDVSNLIPLSVDQWQRTLKKLETQNKILSDGKGRGKTYKIAG